MSFVTYYEQLAEESQTLSENNINRQIWSSINRLPPAHIEFIYFLILHDYLSHGGEEKTPPYGAKIQTGGKGVIFTVRNLPLRLQKILLAYLARISK